MARSTWLVALATALGGPLAACGDGGDGSMNMSVPSGSPGSTPVTPPSGSSPAAPPAAMGDAGAPPLVPLAVGQWSSRLGGPQADTGGAVVSDATGASVVVGTFQGTAILGGVSFTSAGLVDFFVAKYGKDGELAWVQVFGGTGNDAASGVALDASGNILVAGSSDGPLTLGANMYGQSGPTGIFYLELDPFGDLTASNAFGGVSTVTPVQVASGPLGTVALSGSYTIPVDFGGGPLPAPTGACAAFVADIGPDGTLIFAQPLGVGADGAVGNGIAFSADGLTIAVAGTFSGAGTFPSVMLASAGGDDIFVATFDTGGNSYVVSRFGGPGQDDGLAVAFTGGGDIVVGGDFSDSVNFGNGAMPVVGGIDGFVAELTSSGGYVWAKAFGGTGIDQVTSVAGDTMGDVVAAGDFERTLRVGTSTYTSAGESDVFAVKLTNLGAFTWGGHFGGPEIDQTSGVSLDPTGSARVTGFFQDSASFGSGTMTSAGDYDVFVAALAP